MKSLEQRVAELERENRALRGESNDAFFARIKQAGGGGRDRRCGPTFRRGPGLELGKRARRAGGHVGTPGLPAVHRREGDTQVAGKLLLAYVEARAQMAQAPGGGADGVCSWRLPIHGASVSHPR